MGVSVLLGQLKYSTRCLIEQERGKNMDIKENIIKEILFEMSAELDADKLYKLENVIRI